MVLGVAVEEGQAGALIVAVCRTVPPVLLADDKDTGIRNTWKDARQGIETR